VTSGTESIANAPIYPEFQHGKDMKQEKYWLNILRSSHYFTENTLILSYKEKLVDSAWELTAIYCFSYRERMNSH
jgi:hypothetical protein